MSKIIEIDMEKYCLKCGCPGCNEDHICMFCLATQIIKSLPDGKKNYSREDVRPLIVELTDDEVESYGRELGKLIVNKGKLESERAVLAKKMKPMTERLEELAPIVDSGEEVRDVECRWYYDFSTRTKYLIRLDTMKLIDQDIIPDHEFQAGLDLSE